jgi:hypothetical protein
MPSSAAMPVPVVPTQVHPVFDGFAGPQPGGRPKATAAALEPATRTQLRDEDAAQDIESASVSVGVAQLPI